MAVDKMAAQMRRAADRRRVHRGRHTPLSVGQALAGVEPTSERHRRRSPTTTARPHARSGPITVLGDGPLVVREKIHPAAPMTLDQALYEMELVGPRLLPVRRQGDRAAVGGLPPTGYDYGVIAPGRQLSRVEPIGPAGRLHRGHGWGQSKRTARRRPSCHDHPRGRSRNERHRTGGEPIRVVVVDDQELFRRGLTMLLGVEDDIEVVGEAGDGVAATELAASAAPDVVLMDVRMPKRTGIEACVAIKEAAPTARIIMLTVSDEEADLYEAVKNGASGYLLKDSSIDEVAQAVRVVADGQSLISPSMAIKLLDEFKQMSRSDRQQVPHAAADRARARGAPAGRAGPQQPRDRQAAVHQREHRQEPRAQHPGEAPAALPHGGRDVRRAREAARHPLSLGSLSLGSPR